MRAFYRMRLEFGHDLINVQFPFLLAGKHAKEKNQERRGRNRGVPIEVPVMLVGKPSCRFFRRHVENMAVMLVFFASC